MIEFIFDTVKEDDSSQFWVKEIYNLSAETWWQAQALSFIIIVIMFMVPPARNDDMHLKEARVSLDLSDYLGPNTGFWKCTSYRLLS